jgi:hypothetical protein
MKPCLRLKLNSEPGLANFALALSFSCAVLVIQIITQLELRVVGERHPLFSQWRTTKASNNWQIRTFQLGITPWPESVRELCRPSDCRLWTTLVPTSADRGRPVVSAIDPHGRILGFLHRSRYYFFQVAQLYSRGWVDPVAYPLLFRKSCGAGNRTRTSGSVDRRGGQSVFQSKQNASETWPKIQYVWEYSPYSRVVLSTKSTSSSYVCQLEPFPGMKRTSATKSEHNLE